MLVYKRKDKNGREYLYSYKWDDGKWKSIFICFVDKIKNGGKKE